MSPHHPIAFHPATARNGVTAMEALADAVTNEVRLLEDLIGVMRGTGCTPLR